MKQSIFYKLSGILIILCFGCQKETKYSKLSNEQQLRKGEWLNTSNCLNVMSIRKDKIVFIENSSHIGFGPDDVRHYTIIDSFKKIDNTDSHIGQYLIMKGNKDTISLQIISRKDSVITLKKDDINQTFVWKFVAQMNKH